MTLTATPSAGLTFGGWVGAACPGTGDCTVTMDKARSVTAIFDAPLMNSGDNNGGAGASAGAGGDSGLQPIVDLVAPRLTSLRLSASRFRPARSGPSASVGTGARVAFAVTEAGRAVFTVERAFAGRKVGTSCRRPTRSNRGHRSCTRWVRVRGSFSRVAKAGTNRFRFRGRIGGRRLVPARYRLVARVSDSAGNRSTPRRVAFRVVR